MTTQAPLDPRRRELLKAGTALACAAIGGVARAGPGEAPRGRWSEQAVGAWYARQPWLVGANYVPRSAINPLEMWQEASFDPAQIDEELGWAEGLGMNTLRVFLHDLLWQQDADGFRRRIDRFLAICARHRIRALFVLFDSCWDPAPRLGPQHPPIPGIHNSGWVQSPGASALADRSQTPRLQAYVQGVVGAFGTDARVLGWDVWNEPDNDNTPNFPKTELNPHDKRARVAELLPQAFAWARAMRPQQPLTSGISGVDTDPDGAGLDAFRRTQLELSDFISFHNYTWPEYFERQAGWLRALRRPVVCTEYMARGVGSTFDAILPRAKAARIGVYNWGLVAGKTQTWLPWDSWRHPYVAEDPAVWHHDVLRADGTPYRPAEAELLRRLTGRG